MARLSAFLTDRRGNIAVLAAGAMTGLIGTAALGIDLGTMFLDRRRAQSATDLAALAAARDLANAGRAASATIARNGAAPISPPRTVLGRYTADPALPASQRFRTDAGGVPNAARVTLRTRTDLVFGRILTGSEHYEIETTATATTSAFASFAIGSRLAGLEGGVVNGLLGSLLGINLSLSIMDYQALATVDADLFGFLGAVAQRASLRAVTYDDLLQSSVGLEHVLGALMDVVPAGAANRALTDAARAARGAGVTVPLGAVMDAGVYGALAVGERPGAVVAVAARDLLTAVAQAANGRHQVELPLDLSIPSIAAARLRLAIGERPRGTSWVTVGAEGASVHTAQTRLLVEADLAGSGAAALVRLPIYLELAAASATLSRVNCPAGAAGSAALQVVPAVVDAWIGDVSDAEFRNMHAPPRPGPARLLSLAVARVNGRAHATITNLLPRTLDFSAYEIAARTRKTVGTTDFLSSLTRGLVEDLRLDVEVLGLGIGLPLGLDRTVAGIVAGAASPLDRLLSSILSAAGIGLGQADVWVTGARCDRSVLVD